MRLVGSLAVVKIQTWRAVDRWTCRLAGHLWIEDVDAASDATTAGSPAASACLRCGDAAALAAQPVPALS